MEGFACSKKRIKKDKSTISCQNCWFTQKEFRRLLLSIKIGIKIWLRLQKTFLLKNWLLKEFFEVEKTSIKIVA
jgi:hypothetical protein